MLVASIYGLTVGEVYLLRRIDGAYLVSREFNAASYWFVEIFYCLGGLVSIAFGIAWYKAGRSAGEPAEPLLPPTLAPMDYTHQSVSSLLRGPLLFTPQGWVVLASIGVYLTIALLCWLGALNHPLAKNLSYVLSFCIFWPFITFLLFVRSSAPYFSPSWLQAMFVAIGAFMPIVYVWAHD